MTELKQLIHFPATNSVEATWVDDAGVAVRCHSYADVQLDLLRADVARLGGDLAEYEAMLAEVEAAIVPYVPPVIPYDELRRAEYPPLMDLIDGLVKEDQAQIEAYRAACLAVKAKYPKPV